MNVLTRGFLFVSGLFLGFEGLGNLVYWRKNSRRLFQVGRFIRMVLGFSILAVSLFGG